MAGSAKNLVHARQALNPLSHIPSLCNEYYISATEVGAILNSSFVRIYDVPGDT